MRAFVVASVITVLVSIAVTCGGCAKYDDTRVEVDAKVLSVNENILRGEMIGEFLSSANGKIANDVNIVGVEYMIGESLFIQDLELSHALLAYHAGKNVIPISVTFIAWRSDLYKLVARVNGYHVGKEFYTREDMDAMLDIELVNDMYKGGK